MDNAVTADNVVNRAINKFTEVNNGANISNDIQNRIRDAVNSVDTLEAKKTAAIDTATDELRLIRIITPQNIDTIKDAIYAASDDANAIVEEASSKARIANNNVLLTVDAQNRIQNAATEVITVEKATATGAAIIELLRVQHQITQNDIDTIRGAVSGAIDIALAAYDAANNIGALTNGAKKRIDTAVANSKKTYSIPHSSAKYCILVASTLITTVSTMLIGYSILYFTDNSFKKKENKVLDSDSECVLINSKNGNLMLGGTMLVLISFALVPISFRHKKSNDDEMISKSYGPRTASALGGVFFILGAVLTGIGADGLIKCDTSPIGIELEPGRAIDLINLKESTTYFSYSDDGALSRTSWVGPKDALLFYDFNGTDQADHWSKFVITEWSRKGATSDFDALLEVFDTNNDMIFDAQDAAYNDFYIWQDANSNGAIEAGELTQLIEVGIIAIDFNIAAAATPASTSSDTAVVEWANGYTTLAHDLIFQYETESIA